MMLKGPLKLTQPSSWNIITGVMNVTGSFHVKLKYYDDIQVLLQNLVAYDLITVIYMIFKANVLNQSPLRMALLTWCNICGPREQWNTYTHYLLQKYIKYNKLGSVVWKYDMDTMHFLCILLVLCNCVNAI